MSGSRARWTASQATSAGRRALALYQGHAEELVSLLPEGIGASLAADLGRLETSVRAPTPRPPSLDRARALARESVQQLTRMRALIRHESPTDHPVLIAAGVGSRTSATRIPVVLASLQSMATAAAGHEALFLRAGILPEDVEQCSRLHAALAAINRSLEGERTDVGRCQRERQALQRRVEDAVIEISLAGLACFAGNREMVAAFRSLVPRRPRRSHPGGRAAALA